MNLNNDHQALQILKEQKKELDDAFNTAIKVLENLDTYPLEFKAMALEDLRSRAAYLSLTVLKDYPARRQERFNIVFSNDTMRQTLFGLLMFAEAAGGHLNDDTVPFDIKMILTKVLADPKEGVDVLAHR